MQYKTLFIAALFDLEIDSDLEEGIELKFWKISIELPQQIKFSNYSLVLIRD